MKYLAIIGLVTTIIKPNYYNPINNTGNGSFNNFVQTTMQYETLGDGVTVTAGGGLFIGLESSVPLQYAVTIKINLRQVVESASMILYFSTPFVNSYTSFNYICEGCFVTNQGNTTSSSFMNITCYSTSYAEISIIFTAEMLNEMYGYTIINLSNYDPTEVVPWITSGASWFKITSGSLTSVSLGNNPYDSSLNSIMANTDSIESLLQSIVTNTSYLSTISTNISSLSSTLSTINSRLNNVYNTLNYFFKDEQIYQGLTNSLKYRVDNIGEVLNNDIMSIYDGDYIGGTGPSSPAQYITLWDDENHINDTYDKTKLKLVFCLYGQGDTQYYYLDIPVLKSNTNGDSGSHTFAESLYVLQNNSNICRITAQFRITNHYIGYWLTVTQYSLSTGGATNSSRGSNVYRTILTNASLSTINKLDDIIEAINNLSSAFDGINIDMQDKNTVDTFYETLRQQMVFPSVPNTIPDMNLISYLFDLLKISTETPVGGMFPSSIGMYRRWLGIIVIVLVLRRILT